MRAYKIYKGFFCGRIDNDLGRGEKSIFVKRWTLEKLKNIDF